MFTNLRPQFGSPTKITGILPVPGPVGCGRLREWLESGQLVIRPGIGSDADCRVFRSGRSLKLVYAMKSVTQSQNVCPARYGDPVDIFSCNIFFRRARCARRKKMFQKFTFSESSYLAGQTISVSVCAISTSC